MAGFLKPPGCGAVATVAPCSPSPKRGASLAGVRPQDIITRGA